MVHTKSCEFEASKYCASTLLVSAAAECNSFVLLATFINIGYLMTVHCCTGGHLVQLI